MEPSQRGTELWCKHCSVLVHYDEKKFATNNIKGSVERAFSSAELTDATDSQNMNPAFRVTPVAMFCNGKQ